MNKLEQIEKELAELKQQVKGEHIADMKIYMSIDGMKIYMSIEDV